MKNKLILLLLLLLVGCYPIPQLYIGMSEQEFLRETNGRANVESATANYTIYSRCNSYGYNCAYYYFRDGKLYQADHGVRTPDIIIENH